MNLQEAIKVLEDHNKWMCDNSVPSLYEQTEPKKITEAINVVVDQYKSLIISKTFTDDLRSKFFKECADDNIIPKVNMTPHNVIEWFKNNAL